MSNYSKITNFAAKDSGTLDASRLITGTAHDNEYNAIAVAVATKANLISPAFTTPDIGVASGTSLALTGAETIGTSLTVGTTLGVTGVITATGGVVGALTGNATTASTASALASGATGVTPANGDISTLVATTAFVANNPGQPSWVKQFFPSF